MFVHNSTAESASSETASGAINSIIASHPRLREGSLPVEDGNRLHAWRRPFPRPGANFGGTVISEEGKTDSRISHVSSTFQSCPDILQIRINIAENVYGVPFVHCRCAYPGTPEVELMLYSQTCFPGNHLRLSVLLGRTPPFSLKPDY